MQIKKQDLEKVALLQMKKKIEEMLLLLEGGEAEQVEAMKKELMVDLGVPNGTTIPTKVPDGSRILEGVFDGQHMIGADGKQYLVPQNYASKSKLVEGDLMKLSITPEGAFIYKQIGPISRKRIACTLQQSDDGMWHATDGVHTWKLLTAAVTYFKGKAADEAVILIPGDAPSKWAAVENIIGK